MFRFFFSRYPRSHIYTCSKNLFPNFFPDFSVYSDFISFCLLRIIFTSLDFRFSGYFHRCWIFSVYSDFIFLSANSQCIRHWTLNNPIIFCWPSRFRFFVFRKFPDNKVLSRKLLSFVYICETEERGLRYDLSLSDLKIAIIIF